MNIQDQLALLNLVKPDGVLMMAIARLDFPKLLCQNTLPLMVIKQIRFGMPIQNNNKAFD